MAASFVHAAWFLTWKKKKPFRPKSEEEKRRRGPLLFNFFSLLHISVRMCIITPTAGSTCTHIKRRVNHANQGTLYHQSVCILLHTYAIWPATGQIRVTESALIQYKVNKHRVYRLCIWGEKTVGKNGTRSSLARICVQQTKQRLILHSYIGGPVEFVQRKKKGKKKRGLQYGCMLQHPQTRDKKIHVHTT